MSIADAPFTSSHTLMASVQLRTPLHTLADEKSSLTACPSPPCTATGVARRVTSRPD